MSEEIIPMHFNCRCTISRKEMTYGQALEEMARIDKEYTKQRQDANVKEAKRIVDEPTNN
jgi:hypothetical protein